MEDKMAKLFSCNTTTIKVKSEDIGTASASSTTSTSTSIRKHPRVTTPSVIVIEDDDNDDQRFSLSSYTLGSRQELQLSIEGTAVSIYNKNKTKKYMSLTTIQWIKLLSCWKIIDEKLKSYIRNTHGNILKKVQPDSSTDNSGNTANIHYYVTLLNGWPYCNPTEGVRFYLSYMPSFEHMFIKGSGISLRYDEWIHLLALIPAINRERQAIKWHSVTWKTYSVRNIMNLIFMTIDLDY